MASEVSGSGKAFRPGLQLLHQMAQISPTKEMIKHPLSALGYGWWEMLMVFGIMAFATWEFLDFSKEQGSSEGYGSLMGNSHAVACGIGGQTPDSLILLSGFFHPGYQLKAPSQRHHYVSSLTTYIATEKFAQSTFPTRKPDRCSLTSIPHTYKGKAPTSDTLPHE